MAVTDLNEPDQNDQSKQIADLELEINELIGSVQAAQQSLRRVQNYQTSGSAVSLGGTATTSSSSFPPTTRGGISIPFVQKVAATIGSVVNGRTAVTVSWNDVADPTGNVASYNVWMTGSVTGQYQETLVASVQASPASISIQNTKAGVVTFFVQTLLKSGRANPIASCPTASVTLATPTINANDLNVNGIWYGPLGTLILSGFTFSNGPTTSVSWTAGNVSYQGVNYVVASGSTTNANPYVTWDLGTPTVLTGLAQANFVNFTAHTFVIGLNDSSGSPVTQGFFSAEMDIHNNTSGGKGERLLIDADSLNGWNISGNNTFSLARRSTDSTGAGTQANGILRIFNGTQAGGIGSGQVIILEGNSNAAGTGPNIQLAPVAGAPGLRAAGTGGCLYVSAVGALHYVGTATDTQIAPA